jgi:hypothetical protein
MMIFQSVRVVSDETDIDAGTEHYRDCFVSL